jgi:hypothetical protein
MIPPAERKSLSRVSHLFYSLCKHRSTTLVLNALRFYIPVAQVNQAIQSYQQRLPHHTPFYLLPKCSVVVFCPRLDYTITINRLMLKMAMLRCTTASGDRPLLLFDYATKDSAHRFSSRATRLCKESVALVLSYSTLVFSSLQCFTNFVINNFGKEKEYSFRSGTRLPPIAIYDANAPLSAGMISWSLADSINRLFNPLYNGIFSTIPALPPLPDIAGRLTLVVPVSVAATTTPDPQPWLPITDGPTVAPQAAVFWSYFNIQYRPSHHFDAAARYFSAAAPAAL